MSSCAGLTLRRLVLPLSGPCMIFIVVIGASKLLNSLIVGDSLTVHGGGSLTVDTSKRDSVLHRTLHQSKRADRFALPLERMQAVAMEPPILTKFVQSSLFTQDVTCPQKQKTYTLKDELRT